MANRVLLGKKGSDYGLWVSRPGQNVLTANDADMLFSTSAEVVTVMQSGVVQLTAAGAGRFDTVPLNYGYTPFVRVTMIIDNSNAGVTEDVAFIPTIFGRAGAAPWISTQNLVVEVDENEIALENYTGLVIDVAYQVYSKKAA